MPNIVYVLTNEGMPGLVKIGMTDGDTVETRMRQLNTTSVPFPFECYYAAEINTGNSNAVKIEHLLHNLFEDKRVNPKREFFRISPDKVRLALSIGGFLDVTPKNIVVEDKEEQQALAREKTRRSKFCLKKAGINIGDVLLFAKDENIAAIVTEDNKVIYEGETMSLSAAALRAVRKLGYGWPTVSGPSFWMYGGLTLAERRDELEASEGGEE